MFCRPVVYVDEFWVLGFFWGFFCKLTWSPCQCFSAPLVILQISKGRTPPLQKEWRVPTTCRTVCSVCPTYDRGFRWLPVLSPVAIVKVDSSRFSRAETLSSGVTLDFVDSLQIFTSEQTHSSTPPPPRSARLSGVRGGAPKVCRVELSNFGHRSQ